MRDAETMLALIMNVAKTDERVRAVVLSGSRANPGASLDPFQDFDIVYVVTDLVPFVADHSWIDRFGERMILQMPDAMGDPPPEEKGGFAYLMQFVDGNRIDLTLAPTDQVDSLMFDSLSVPLLDKDGLLPPLAPPSDRDYLPKAPNAKAFEDCCNEFWWVCPYVAKGLWRSQLVYAKFCHDSIIRPQLTAMLTWYVGVHTDFSRSTGTYGKYLQRELEPELRTLLLATYADADEARSWDALMVTCTLFRSTATYVAQHFGFAYPHADDQRVSAHLLHVRALPKNTSRIY